MSNHISHAALPYPIKGCRFTILIPYIDADGDPTDAVTPDTERSIDAAAFADCTEEVSTITGSNGMGYITLTGDETNGSAIAVCAKVASGPKATLATLYPRVLPIFTSGTAQAGASGTITLASGASAIDDLYNGCIIRTTGGTGGAGGSGSLGNQARVITDYVGSTKVATISPAWETTPSSDTTYEVLLCETALISFANAVQMTGTTLTARDIGASVLLSSGTGTGQLDFTSGVVKSSLVQILGTALTETSGQIAAAFKKFFDKATPTGTINSLPDAVAGAAGGVFIAGTNAATTVTTALTTTFTGNLTGSVGSVSGAVGSVTGNVGGNVTGSVGSVASGGIVAASFAAGAIDAAAIAADAIGSSELAATAAAEIATQVRTELTTELGRIDAAVSTRSSHTPAQAAAAVWDYLTSAATTVGSLGKLLVDNIDAAVSSRLATAGYTAPLTAAGVRTAVGLASANLDTQLAAIDTQTDLIPASPAAVGSAMTLASGSITAAVVATGAIDADALATDAVNEIADGLLNRDMATGTDSGSPTVRTVRQALRMLRNKFALSGTTLSVYKENDTDVSWSSTVTTDASADPVTGSDPA